MQIRDVMTPEVCTVTPSTTLRDAARLMNAVDAGALPVADGERLVGMITDRDIAVRGVGLGKGPDTAVADIMSHEVLYCFDDHELGEVAQNLAEIQVRRLPVLDRGKRLVGIVSLADIVLAADGIDSSLALEGITRPGGMHNQAQDLQT